MTESTFDRGIILILRILMGWTFLYAGVWQIWENNSAAGFLQHVVTFHHFFAIFATPEMLPYTNILMKLGHLLIGLSLVFGCMVRLSGLFGILLMITYYFAHMQWPYIENHDNFIVNYHLVYTFLILYLMVHHAGRVFGIDGLIAKRYPRLWGLFG